jgi:hypothetical protein
MTLLYGLAIHIGKIVHLVTSFSFRAEIIYLKSWYKKDESPPSKNERPVGYNGPMTKKSLRTCTGKKDSRGVRISVESDV